MHLAAFCRKAYTICELRKWSFEDNLVLDYRLEAPQL